ncbi:MAG: CRTAC1 family protein [Candidatus Latescibacteria bacterium]|nr:CRTAC1 family protein [Candidatus Latescibacterota bacterium]
MQFVDVAAQAGIHFVHHNGISPEKRMPETYGSGAAFFDCDGDGDLDLYLVNSGDLVKGREDHWNELYRNDGGRFAEVGAAAGVQGREYGMGVLAGDYDNDGDQDLYLASLGPDILYRNEGGRFTDQAAAAGLGSPLWGSSAAYSDYDNDGDLDLWVINYLEYDAGEPKWCGRRDMNLRFYCDPRQYPPSHDLLYRNNGNGTFSDVSLQAGITHQGNGLGVVCGDFDGDGDQDTYITNDLTQNWHYLNQGDGTFREMGLLTGTGLSADGAMQAGMGVDAGDYDNDLDLDLLVTNFQLENKNLYRNDGGYFPDLSFKSGIGEASLNSLGFGTFFFDYDNDGWQDVFMANGHVHDNIEAYDPLATYAQKAQLFRNLGQGRFAEQTAVAGPAFAAHYVGRGAAYGDYDLDGDLDLALISSGRPAALLRNDGGNAGHWLQVELKGRQSNRDGVGARVYLQAGGRRLFQQVKAGSGYQSTSQRALHFGLGAEAQPVRVEVRWPSGAVQVAEGVAVDQVLRLEELP